MFLKKNKQSCSPLLIFSLKTRQESESSTSVTIYVESPEESNTFQPIQNPVNSIDTVEEEVIDEEYWTHPLEEINIPSSDDSDAESGKTYTSRKENDSSAEMTDALVVSKAHDVPATLFKKETLAQMFS